MREKKILANRLFRARSETQTHQISNGDDDIDRRPQDHHGIYGEATGGSSRHGEAAPRISAGDDDYPRQAQRLGVVAHHRRDIDGLHDSAVQGDVILGVAVGGATSTAAVRAGTTAAAAIVAAAASDDHADSSTSTIVGSASSASYDCADLSTPTIVAAVPPNPLTASLPQQH